MQVPAGSSPLAVIAIGHDGFTIVIIQKSGDSFAPAVVGGELQLAVVRWQENARRFNRLASQDMRSGRALTSAKPFPNDQAPFFQ
jgi:hypothetical protein